jgi:TPR repeat protein
MLQLAMQEKDPGKFSEGIRRAAEAGDGHAMVHVAAGFGIQPGDDRGDSRAWLDKAFATGDPEVIVHAASMLQDQSQQERNAERLGMTKEEMQAKAIEVLRAGCKGNVPAAYRDLAIAFRRGSGVEKSEKESEELMEKFNRLEGQRAARGSVAARFNLMVALQVSGGEDDEVLRLAEEILERSNYVGHYTAAALFGARSVEGSDPQSAEGIQRGLDWLKKLQEEKNDDGIASLIANYESRLAKAARTSAGQ